MKVLLALLLVIVMPPMVRADTASGDDIEELRLQRELSEKAAAYLKENEAAIRQFTGKDVQEFVSDPVLLETIEHDKSLFEQRQKEVENVLDE